MNNNFENIESNENVNFNKSSGRILDESSGRILDEFDEFDYENDTSISNEKIILDLKF